MPAPDYVDHDLVEIQWVRHICDDVEGLLAEAAADPRSVRLPMLLMLARGRLKDNGFTTPKGERT